jgi:hypothetical protein
VSESGTSAYRYLIATIIDEDLPVGAKFKPSVLHITVLPWFALETEEGPFLNWFYKHFENFESFKAVASKRAMFGPRNDVPVSILTPQDKFMDLHTTALSWFGALGARWAEKDPYVGDDYVPHIAQRRGYVIGEKQNIRIGSVSLWKASRHEDQVRIVAAKAILK